VNIRQPSFGNYFSLAYQDAYRLLQTMWQTVLIVVAAVIILGFVGNLLGNHVGTRLGHSVLDLLVTAGTAYIIAPYVMVLYRAVLSPGPQENPEALRRTPEAQRFAAWSVLTAFIIAAPELLFAVAGPGVPAEQLTEENVNAGAMMLVLALTIAVWIFSVRATTLMPLLALDPAGASLPRAFAQSKGHFWFIVGVLLITMLPLLLGGVVLTGLVAGMFGPFAPILLVPVGAAVTGVTLVTAIAVSTRLYQRYADR
jgi:hypothetical protein